MSDKPATKLERGEYEWPCDRCGRMILPVRMKGRPLQKICFSCVIAAIETEQENEGTPTNPQ